MLYDELHRRRGRIVDMGFCCTPAFDRDAWLSPLRSDARFVSAYARARCRRSQAEERFHEAGGACLLGLAEI